LVRIFALVDAPLSVVSDFAVEKQTNLQKIGIL
jgi:hypothetical protein